MNTVRRCTVGVVVLALAWCSSLASAQVLKQLPANALLVLKINNPDNISQKLGAMAQKLGLTNFEASFADPLGALKKKFNIKEGFDGKGEVAIAMYEPGPNEGEPRFVVLLPVSDFKAFMANVPGAKQEDKLTVFTVAGDNTPLYAVNWGSYAAISDARAKDVLGQTPAGMGIAGLVRKQLDGNDLTLFANVKLLGSKALPMLQGIRPMVTMAMEGELKNNLQFNQKYLPLLKAAVEQGLNIAEGILRDGQSASVGLNLANEGLNFTCVAEFDSNSYAGKLFSGAKNSDANLLAGLPVRKYFAFFGGAVDKAAATQTMNDLLAPISKELTALGDDAKSINLMIEAAKTSFNATDTIAAGYAQPTAPPGQQSILQEIAVSTGDAKKIAAAADLSMQGAVDMMKLMPQQKGASVNFTAKPAAKTVDGVSLNQLSMQFNFDTKTPEGMMASQMINMMYGGNSLIGYSGIVDDKTFMVEMGGPEELLTATITAARKHETGMGDSPKVKAVTAQLPAKRLMVGYVALDNIVGTALQFAQQFGMPIQIKLPSDLPPIGFSVGTEGPALRVDTHISSELIENMVSAGIQAAMMQRGGGAPPAPPKAGAL